MFLALTGLVVSLLGLNGTCLYEFVLRDFRTFIHAPLNSPARVDTFRYQNHVSSTYIDPILAASSSLF